MAKDSTRDMTVGSPMKLILEFSIPLLLGALFQQFYSVMDTIIVGRQGCASLSLTVPGLHCFFQW